jgi:hypothetical protein
MVSHSIFTTQGTYLMGKRYLSRIYTYFDLKFSYADVERWSKAYNFHML